MAQQTAVDFLIESIDADARGLWTKELRKKAEQAKQIEREQHESTCVEVIERILDKLEKGENTNSQDVFNEYYTKTYGNKQTAVEWFAYQVEKMLFDLKKNNDVFQLELCLHGLNELEEQAKRMFEEQIIAACNQTDVIGLDYEQPGEQYYTKTYGK